MPLLNNGGCMVSETVAIRELRKKYSERSVHQANVFGIPIWMFYTVYPGDDPSCPYPYIEAFDLFTSEGIHATWVPEEEIKHMEDNIFAARYTHTRAGKRYR